MLSLTSSIYSKGYMMYLRQRGAIEEPETIRDSDTKQQHGCDGDMG